MYQILSYIKFLLKSTNKHGVHSPFVYNLITKCFYDKTDYDTYKPIKHYRESLLLSKEKLHITDLGEGSKTLDPKERYIKSMAKTSGSSLKFSKLLFRLTRYFKFNQSLELGTSLGIATHAIALARAKNTITTIEGCSNTSDYAQAQFRKNNITNTTFIKGDFTAKLPTLKPSTFDFVFFDGHHNKAATLQYFNSLLPKATNASVFVFDDIYWSKEMTEAWEEIISNNKVTVSIDIFHLGFVFFRKEQPKQHFKIRV
jgi:predicted O-methyltransferase YrrM